MVVTVILSFVAPVPSVTVTTTCPLPLIALLPFHPLQKVVVSIAFENVILMRSAFSSLPAVLPPLTSWRAVIVGAVSIV